MYLDQYVVSSIVLVAVMVVASFWSIKKVKELIAKDSAAAGNKK